MDEENVNKDQFSFRMRHSAPGGDPETDIPLHDLTTNLPKDIYEKLHLFTKNPLIKATILAVRNKPGALVKIHRAAPVGVRGFNPGDWVTLDRAYAQQHGNSNLNGNFKIISRKVKAGDLFTEGDLNEWGWHPKGDA
jgi:hypothetical protein